MARMVVRLQKAAGPIENPSLDELDALVARMPQARRTRYGNLNIRTRVIPRPTASTFVVTDRPDHGHPTISREEGRHLAEAQDAYVARQAMVQVDGYIGNDPGLRVTARLLVEAENANIAAMQQQLYFPAEGGHFEPELAVVHTPGLAVKGFPDGRLVTVDLELGVTRVFNSDYFGAAKKGGLRMWNKLVYDRGGLALHGGCKIIPTDRGERVCLAVGPSGSGKTTTTFCHRDGSRPVQDHFVAWMPNGRVHASEGGCFAKTFGLNPEDQPTIHAAVTQPDSYLENVSQVGDDVDFYDTSYTKAGRATCLFRVIESAAEERIEQAHFLLVLNRNENLIPAVAKLEAPEAAAFFMLGETRGPGAGNGSSRIPGGNKLFPLPHDLQGNRFLELLEEHPLDVYLMNTGRVGGPEADERSQKVRIRHSSAIVKAIAQGTIEWERDPDFGYLVATGVPGIDDEDQGVLRPRELYRDQGRGDEYRGRRAVQGGTPRFPPGIPQPLRRDRRRRRLKAAGARLRTLPERPSLEGPCAGSPLPLPWRSPSSSWAWPAPTVRPGRLESPASWTETRSTSPTGAGFGSSRSTRPSSEAANATRARRHASSRSSSRAARGSPSRPTRASTRRTVTDACSDTCTAAART